MDVAGHCNVEEKYGTFTQYGMNIDSNLSIHPAKLELKEDGAQSVVERLKIKKRERDTNKEKGKIGSGKSRK